MPWHNGRFRGSRYFRGAGRMPAAASTLRIHFCFDIDRHSLLCVYTCAPLPLTNHMNRAWCCSCVWGAVADACCGSGACAANRSATNVWIGSLYIEVCFLLTIACLLVFTSWTDWAVVTNCALLPLHAMQIDSSIRHGHLCAYETVAYMDRVGLGCYSAAWLRILTLALDAVALSKIIYNTTMTTSDSAITQTVFVSLLFAVSFYRAQKFFVRVVNTSEASDDAPFRGHGFAFLLIKNFSAAATNSGGPERLQLIGGGGSS